jgi:hypothetical protein
MSPYWGHLDYTTLAMTGIMTPQGKQMPPRTPGREVAVGGVKEEDKKDIRQKEDSGVTSAQSLFTSSQHYNPYGSYGAMEGYAPPSPATQFMLSHASPQANAQAAAYYAYNYGGTSYYTSPGRPIGSWRKSPHKSSTNSSGSPTNGKAGTLLPKVDETATTPQRLGHEGPGTIESGTKMVSDS